MRPRTRKLLSAVAPVCPWIAGAAAALLLLLRKRYQRQTRNTAPPTWPRERRPRQPLDKLRLELGHSGPLGKTITLYTPGPERCLGGLPTLERMSCVSCWEGRVFAWGTHTAESSAGKAWCCHTHGSPCQQLAFHGMLVQWRSGAVGGRWRGVAVWVGCFRALMCVSLFLAPSLPSLLQSKKG